MSNMFNGCPRIEQLNISEWNVSRVKNMTGMFDGCNSLRRLPNWYKETEETK
jgi:surface protein